MKPGLYPNMPAEAYHRDPLRPDTRSLSSSGARKILATCPAQYVYDADNPPEPSDALRIGSAAHEWLLEGETWPQRHVVLPDDFNGRTKAGKEQLEAIEAEGKRAGLWDKQGPWKQYPKRMLQVRARGFCLRDGFADVLKGLSVREEVQDYRSGAIDAQVTSSTVNLDTLKAEREPAPVADTPEPEAEDASLTLDDIPLTDDGFPADDEGRS